MDAKLVLVIVEGGLSTLTLAYDRIKNKVPIVIVNNTGGIANIIAYAYDSFKPGDSLVSTIGGGYIT